jgi:hypothetical protein
MPKGATRASSITNYMFVLVAAYSRTKVLGSAPTARLLLK